MENFTAYNPTKLHFGKGVNNNLGETVLEFGKRVLLIHGKGSIQRNGVYDLVINQLKSIQAEVFEYSGIKSNPLITDVREAAKVGKENNIDVILAAQQGNSWRPSL